MMRDEEQQKLTEEVYITVRKSFADTVKKWGRTRDYTIVNPDPGSDEPTTLHR